MNTTVSLDKNFFKFIYLCVLRHVLANDDKKKSAKSVNLVNLTWNVCAF